MQKKNIFFLISYPQAHYQSLIYCLQINFVLKLYFATANIISVRLTPSWGSVPLTTFRILIREAQNMRIRIPNASVINVGNSIKKDTVSYVSMVSKCKNLSNWISFVLFQVPGSKSRIFLSSWAVWQLEAVSRYCNFWKDSLGSPVFRFKFVKRTVGWDFWPFFLPPMTFFLLWKLIEPSVPSAYAFSTPNVAQVFTKSRKYISSLYHIG